MDQNPRLLIVQRSEPSRPFVMAEVVGDAVGSPRQTAEDAAGCFVGIEIMSESELAACPGGAKALMAWRSGDDSTWIEYDLAQLHELILKQLRAIAVKDHDATAIMLLESGSDAERWAFVRTYRTPRSGGSLNAV